MPFVTCAMLAAAGFGVGVGARALEFFFFTRQHLYPQTCHHQGKCTDGYSQYYNN